MKSRTSTIKILVTDYDKCAFTNAGTHPKLLSKSLINFAVTNKYNGGFYGCTHRCMSLLPYLENHALEKFNSEIYSRQSVLENFPTYKITENFQQATSLPCQAVSTLDDIHLGECGIGFETIIKPYEMQGKKPQAGLKFASQNDFYANSKSKNNQLLQIAKHATIRHPGVERIILDYVDDNVTLCNKALSACNDSVWPKHVSLNVFQHLADGDHAAVTPRTVSTARKRKPDVSEAGVLKTQGLFAPAARTEKTSQPADRERAGLVK